MELLLGKGANFDAKDSNGNTALMLALQNGQTAAMELLLSKRADVEVMTDEDLAADQDGKELIAAVVVGVICVWCILRAVCCC